MHIVEIPICTTKYEDVEINSRFYAIFHLHNILIKHGIKLLTQLKYNKDYQATLSKYRKLKAIL